MKALELRDATASLADYAREVDKEPANASRKGRHVSARILGSWPWSSGPGNGTKV